MPHEVEAELAGGLLPKELTAEHSRRASTWVCTPPTCRHRWAVGAARPCSRFWYRNSAGG